MHHPQPLLSSLCPMRRDLSAMPIQCQCQNTILVPQTPVQKIGLVFPPLCWYLADTPPTEWILFSKLEISGGCWQPVVQGDDCFNFAYVLPQHPGLSTCIVVPSGLQMGWMESPTYCCNATETIHDIMHHAMNMNSDLPHHSMGEKMPAQYIPPHAHATSPTCLLQVYMDAFCNATTQSTDGHY